MGDWITDTITRMGELGVFLLTLLETVFPPIPSQLARVQRRALDRRATDR